VPNLPVLPFADWLRLGEVAFALVMILYAESYGSISAFALKHGDRCHPTAICWRWGLTCVRPVPWHAGGRRIFGDIGQRGGGCHVTVGRGVAALVVLVIVLTVLPYIALTPEPSWRPSSSHALARG
jgi:hypothetical protein